MAVPLTMLRMIDNSAFSRIPAIKSRAVQPCNNLVLFPCIMHQENENDLDVSTALATMHLHGCLSSQIIASEKALHPASRQARRFVLDNIFPTMSNRGSSSIIRIMSVIVNRASKKVLMLDMTAISCSHNLILAKLCCSPDQAFEAGFIGVEWSSRMNAPSRTFLCSPNDFIKSTCRGILYIRLLIFVVYKHMGVDAHTIIATRANRTIDPRIPKIFRNNTRFLQRFLFVRRNIPIRR